MQDNRFQADNGDSLPPFPEGWYFVASRKEILNSKLIQKAWLGVNIVAWCDDEERICVAEAVCPHLGADLGPVAGGQVREGCLVCPFHGFEYATSGECVATPNAPAPKSANLRVFETRNVLGMIFAWWGIGGRPPQWSLPADPPSGREWSEIGYRTMRFAGHPQETTENSVDLAHLSYVHGYDSIARVGPVSVDGAEFKRAFDFRRCRRIAGIASTMFDVSAVVRVFGLGYSLVEIKEHSIGMQSRLWVLATPVDGTLIEMVLASQVREIRKPKRFIMGLGFLPVPMRARLMNKIMLSAQKADVLQDVLIWAKKRYLSRPRLCRSDGEIGPFRRYCRQFYPEDPNSGREESKEQSVQASPA